MEDVTALMASVLDQGQSRLSVDDAQRLFDRINEVFRERVLDLDRHDICLFLPHCLRSRSCPAASDDEGIHCEHCGQCVISGFVSAAEDHGFGVFCVPGGSLLEKLVRKHRPKAIIGVACVKEILLGLRLLWDKGFMFLVFPLEKEGCFETKIRPEPLLALLSTPGPEKKLA